MSIHKEQFICAMCGVKPEKLGPQPGWGQIHIVKWFDQWHGSRNVCPECLKKLIESPRP